MALVLGIAGCVRESVDQAEHVFQYEWWVPLVSLLGGLAVGYGAWMLRGFSIRLSVTLVVLAIVLAIVGAPSSVIERAVVNNDEFRIQGGVWGLTVRESMRFDEIREIQLTAEEGKAGTRYSLRCVKNIRESATVSMHNALMEAAGAAILEVAKGRGIPVVDDTNGK